MFIKQTKMKTAIPIRYFMVFCKKYSAFLLLCATNNLEWREEILVGYKIIHLFYSHSTSPSREISK